MAELLMGMETEYALVALSPRGTRIEQDDLMQRLMDRAVAAWPHLPARTETGIYLPNGGRLYVDTGGHLEFSTPECTSPVELVRHVAAGDEMVLALATGLAARDGDIAEVAVLRSNVDYASGNTWGCHESYLHTVPDEALSPLLLPLLCSRVVLGAGGFDVRAPGIRFVLSPRAPFIECARSASSVSARGLHHVKEEPLAGHGFRRLHLICGESLVSEFGTYVKVGTTALAIAMVEAGLDPAAGLELRDPIQALGVFNGDSSLQARAPSTGGEMLCALDIQRRYLERAEGVARRSFMPEWAPAFCARWRIALDGLERDPLLLDTALDWPIKQRLFAAHAERVGMGWGALRPWNRLARLRAGRPEPGAAPPGEAPAVGGSGRLERLRHALFALDMKFAQLGPDGLATRLELQGAFVHRRGKRWPLDIALWRTPQRGRARTRGAAIARLVGQRGQAACDWTAVVDGEGRILDLSHPWQSPDHWEARAEAGSGTGAISPGARRRAVLLGHADRVTWLSWAADGRLASASRDGTVRLWDVAAGRCLRVLGPVAGEIAAVAWGPEGQVAAIAGGRVRIWDGDGALRGEQPHRDAAPAGCVSWTGAAGAPAGGRLAVGCADGCVRLLGPQGQRLGCLAGNAGAVHAVAQTPDGRLVASAADHGDLGLWSAAERALVAHLKGHQGPVRALACSPEDRWLASAGDDSTIRLWDISARAPGAVLRGHRRGVSEITFNGDGTVLASRGEDRTLRLWRTDTWSEIGTVADEVLERRPRGLAFHPRLPWIAVPDGGSAIRIWDLAEAEPPATV
jgi:proteasome accessory factor A